MLSSRVTEAPGNEIPGASVYVNGDEPQGVDSACAGRRLCGDRGHRTCKACEMEAA